MFSFNNSINYNAVIYDIPLDKQYGKQNDEIKKKKREIILKQKFSELDNGKGYIEIDCFEKDLLNRGIQSTEIKILSSSIDQNHDQKISWCEYYNFHLLLNSKIYNKKKGNNKKKEKRKKDLKTISTKRIPDSKTSKSYSKNSKNSKISKLYSKNSKTSKSYSKLNISDKQLSEFQTQFQFYDTDNSGFIDRFEFQTASEKLNVFLSTYEIDLFFQEFDPDNTGISFEQFISYINKNSIPPLSLDEIKEFFAFINTENNGFISLHKLKKTLQNINPSISNKDFYCCLTIPERVLPLKQYNSISLEEFTKIIKSLAY